MKKFSRLIVKKDDKYLLLKETKQNYDYWNFPGGKVEENETPDIAGKRELSEELNLDAENMKFLFSIPCNFYNTDWIGYYFYCEVENFDKIKINEPEKCTGYSFFSLNEIKKIEKLGIPDDIINKITLL